jgi:undecaprenyl-diphosphatase
MTSLLQGFILGAVQGITEWLPISSEGINTLVLLHFFQKPLSEAIQISLWLHSGTLLAALIYFKRDIISLLHHLPQYLRQFRTNRVTEPNTLITFLIVATLISGALGAPLLFLSLSMKAIWPALATAIIGGFLIITGLVQKYALRSAGRKRALQEKDAIVVGLVQGLSVLPGLSRSGLTVSTLLFQGYSTKQAIRVSFLMSIPAVLAVVIWLSIFDRPDFNLPAVVSIATALLFGWLTIGALLRIAERIPFWTFCLVIGVISLLPLIIETLLI